PLAPSRTLALLLTIDPAPPFAAFACSARRPQAGAGSRVADTPRPSPAQYPAWSRPMTACVSPWDSRGRGSHEREQRVPGVASRAGTTRVPACPCHGLEATVATRHD